MKHKHITIIASALLFASSSFASVQGNCGIGKVTKLYAGGWDTNSIIFVIDFSIKTRDSYLPSSMSEPYMRIAPITGANPSNNESRQNRIFALLQASLLSGRNVALWTHLGNCDKITEVRLTDGND